MPYDVYAKADGRNREYRRGGFLFFTDEPVRLDDEQVTDELRSDPWLFLVPVEGTAVDVAPKNDADNQTQRTDSQAGGGS